MKIKGLWKVALGIMMVSFGTTALAEDVPPVATSTTQQTTQATSATPATPELSPEEKAYQASMIKISDAIVKKIAEIEAKQKEIDNEVYLASKPPLEAEKNALQEELKNLEMTRDRMQAEKTAQDLSKKNNN